MDISAIARRAFVPKHAAALRFEKEGNTKFRDRVIFYYDGRMLFERFCWGEAAGLVFTAWADGVAPDGEIQWRRPFDAAVKPEALPQKVTLAQADAVCFDDSSARWGLESTLKSDPAHGYGGLKVFFGRLAR